MKPFIAYFKPYRLLCFLALTIMLAVNLLTIAFPYGIKIIIDEVIGQKDNSLLLKVVIVLAVISVARFILDSAKEYLIAHMSEEIIRRLREKLFRHYLSLSVRYIESKRKGDLIAHITSDIESIKKFLVSGFLDGIYAFFTFACLFIVLYSLHVKLALLTLAFLPFFSLVYYKSIPVLERKYRIVREAFGDLTHKVHETLNGIRVIAGLGQNAREQKMFGRIQKRVVRDTVSVHFLSASLGAGAEFISALGIIVLLGVGTHLLLQGGLSLGTLTAFYAYTGLLFIPVIRLSIISTYYQEAKAAQKRIDSVLQEKPSLSTAVPLKKIHRLHGDIIFDAVCFAYPRQEEILHDINLAIRQGEKIAIVGASGEGKTTLINLLLRFYDPSEGRIMVDNHDLRDFIPDEYRAQLGVVFQDDYLFSSTVRDNILYSRTPYSLYDVVTAAKQALAHHFIERLPRQYDTFIGERGVRLSGGQRQRISLARAFYRNPRILILDEPTSYLDVESERHIVERIISDIAQGRTTIVISHRLASIAQVDKIAVLDQGRIVESGTHEELLKNGGRYRQLWQAQEKGTKIQFPLPLKKSAG